MAIKSLPLSVPAHAMILLDFIGDTEAPAGYDTIYGNNQDKLPKPLTSMMLGDIVDAQPTWTKRFKSSACGRFQFMRNTLQSICRELPDVRGDLVFTRALQDRLAYYLLLRRGYERFIAGGMSVAQFGLALAQEWASFPVLAPVKGQKRMVERGESYYAGDALNKALVSPAKIEKVLRQVLLAADKAAAPAALVSTTDVAPATPPGSSSDQGGAGSAAGLAHNVDPEKLDKPLFRSKTVWQWLLTTILMPVLAVFQDWRVQLAIVVIIACFAAYAIKRRADIGKVYRDLKSDLGQ